MSTESIFIVLALFPFPPLTSRYCDRQLNIYIGLARSKQEFTLVAALRINYFQIHSILFTSNVATMLHSNVNALKTQ